MANIYVLDACALVAFVKDETGAGIVQNVLDEANAGNAEVYMNKLNLFEVYYGFRKADGYERAEELYNMALTLPITVIEGISDDVFREAGRIKSSYKISLADAIALGEASILKASLLTSDHHEFDAVEENENITFTWIR
jgi:predicted nucleic acid-binding protein